MKNNPNATLIYMIKLMKLLLHKSGIVQSYYTHHEQTS